MVKPAPPLLQSLLLGTLTVTLVTSQILFGQRSGCPTECKYVYDPICGSDGVSYPNLCFFTRANCNTSVRAVKRGSCSFPDPCSFICDRMYNPTCGSDGVTYANPCVLLYFSCYYANGIQPRHNGKCIIERPCPTSCPTENDPVCGSDGKTYANPCLMLLEACKGRRLTTARNGPCKKCGRRCTREYLPVCGSDGLTYPNVCLLRRRRCNGQRITKAHDGPCAPPQRPCPARCTSNYAPVCASDGNTYNNQCTLDATNCQGSTTTITKIYDGECVRNQRECPVFCPASYEPVCGSDGKTYGNQCTLDVVSCKDPTIKKQSNGECGTPQRPCPDVCPEVYSPVCGTDGKTYDNDCALKAASCKNPSIILSDSGECATTDPSSAPKPPCANTCARVYSPVCGSDGRTYFNLCLLKLVACRDDRPLSAVRGGRCDDRMTSTPRCPVSCNRQYEPVCGSNGVTYDNQCLLTLATCRDPSINKASDGLCAPAQQPDSGDSCVKKCSIAYEPVCGSDRVTYNSQCTFENAVCKEPALTKRYNGTCR